MHNHAHALGREGEERLELAQVVGDRFLLGVRELAVRLGISFVPGKLHLADTETERGRTSVRV